MKVERDLRKLDWVVRINKDELNEAFSSEEKFFQFIREVAINTVGEEIADRLFIDKGAEHDS